MTETESRPRCFVAMPMSVRPEHQATYPDAEHFDHVLEHLFVPAIEAAGYQVVRPAAEGSSHITAGIIANLTDCDMVLADLSTLNPNVFMEIGIRTAIDRPVALVRDEHVTSIPFDIASLHVRTYNSDLRPWHEASQIDALTKHLESARELGDQNQAWRYYAPSRTGERPPPLGGDDLVLLHLQELTAKVEQLHRASAVESVTPLGLRGPYATGAALPWYEPIGRSVLPVDQIRLRISGLSGTGDLARALRDLESSGAVTTADSVSTDDGAGVGGTDLIVVLKGKGARSRLKKLAEWGKSQPEVELRAE